MMKGWSCGGYILLQMTPMWYLNSFGVWPYYFITLKLTFGGKFRYLGANLDKISLDS